MVDATKPARSTLLVALQGSDADEQTIRLACLLAQERGATLRALYVIQVPPALPLQAWHGAEQERARACLAMAGKIAETMGCQLWGTVLPARDVGQAIVDEAAERAADLVVLALGPTAKQKQVAWHVVQETVCAVVAWRSAPGTTDRVAP